MRSGTVAVAVLWLILVLTVGCAKRFPASGTMPPSAPSPEPPPASKQVDEMSFTITSSAFPDRAPIPKRYTGDGADVSPPLSWGKPPEGTVSLALIYDDPDAPRGTFTHWVLYGLPPTLTSLPEAVPSKETLADLGGAKQGLNDGGKVGYMGPAPPRGPVHHYRFTLYALDTQVKLAARARKAQLEKAMQGHVIGQSQLVGTYGR
jgi:Raf kinase inhibitor-like YbhB/YbcL family protein